MGGRDCVVGTSTEWVWAALLSTFVDQGWSEFELVCGG